MSRKACRTLIPALLIRTSTRPSRRTASANAVRTSSSLETSAVSAPLSCGSCFLIASFPRASRSRTATFAPSSRKRAAVAAPMPLAPPVIRTPLPPSPRIRPSAHRVEAGILVRTGRRRAVPRGGPPPLPSASRLWQHGGGTARRRSFAGCAAPRPRLQENQRHGLNLPNAPRLVDGAGDAAFRGGTPEVARPVRACASFASRRRADELDDALVRAVPDVREGGARGAL